MLERMSESGLYSEEESDSNSDNYHEDEDGDSSYDYTGEDDSDNDDDYSDQYTDSDAAPQGEAGSEYCEERQAGLYYCEGAGESQVRKVESKRPAALDFVIVFTVSISAVMMAFYLVL